MRAVVQRVSEASVTIGGVVKGEIRAGLVVLVGIEETDTAEDIEWLSGKLTRLRIDVGLFGSEVTARLFLARLRLYLPAEPPPPLDPRQSRPRGRHASISAGVTPQIP